jgi:fructose-1,6-bisphosphatase/inositol monophosphatase family enzyme
MKPTKNGVEDANHFIEVFRLAALQAGCLAKHLQEEVRLKTKKGETSAEGRALTSVDLAAQDVILLLLHHVFPEVNIDAEEETDTVRLFSGENRRPIIVIDPIDGTLNYGEGLRDYAVMGAWLEEDAYQSALVHFPHRGHTYWARYGRGCRFEKAGNKSRDVTVGCLPERVMITPDFPVRHSDALRASGFEVAVSRCSAADPIVPVTGQAAAALSSGKPDRRRAIGCLLTLEAGGAVWTGGRWWEREDPVILSECSGIIVVLASKIRAKRVLEVLSSEDSDEVSINVVLDKKGEFLLPCPGAPPEKPSTVANTED